MEFYSQPRKASATVQHHAYEPPYTPAALTDDDVNNTVIPWAYVEKALRRKSNVLELAATLFLRVLLIIAFAFFFFPFTKAAERFTIFGSMAYPFLYTEISKFKESFFFRDITTPAQYGDFVMDVVLPILADYKVPTGPNLLLGALRLRTQRVLPQSCKLYSSVVLRGIDQRFQVCYGPLTNKFEDVGEAASLYNREDSWHYGTCQRLGGVSLQGYLGSYHCGGYYFDVPLWQPYNNATDPESCTFESCTTDPELLYLFTNPEYIKTSLSELQNKYLGPRLSSGTPFIDDVATRLVVTELAVYNPNLHFFLLVKLFAESGAGGSWKTSTKVTFLSVWDGTFRGYNGYSIFFFIYMLANLAWFVVKQVRKVRRDGFMASLLQLWTLVDIVTYGLLIASCSLRFVWFAKTSAARVRLAEITYRNAYPTELDVLAERQVAALYVNGVVTVLLFVSLLPYFGIEQRVRRVLDSFLHYQNALVGVVLVSLLILTAFALAGQQLLGTQLWDFRTVDAAFRTLFFIQIRQVDLNEFASAPGNRVEKIFFVYASVLMCFYIILGALSGVARQAFDDTLQTEPSTEPIWWVWRRFCLVMSSPRRWPRYLLDFLRGHSESNRLHEASRILQRYRKAKYAVVLHVKEKRDHYVTHQDWQLAFVDAVGPMSGIHTHFGHRGSRDFSNDRVPGVGATAAQTGGIDADRAKRSHYPPTPNRLSSRDVNRGPTGFSPFLDDLDGSASSSTPSRTQLSASQEEAIRAYLHWVEMTWRDLVFEYLRTQGLSRTARRTKKEIEWMTCGVQGVIGEHLDLLAQFPSRLASLERQIVVLSNELVPISFTSKVLASHNKGDNEEDDDEFNNNLAASEQRDPTTSTTT